jgi:pimeloyl-ACP methyl ester carboxylesterase
MISLGTHVSGSGPAVLWLHGYTMDSSLWAELWELLPGFRHIGVDLPGHGASAPGPAGLTLPVLTAGLAAVAREADARRVVALSFGTIMALQLAIDFPDQVERLVVGAPTISGRPAEPGIPERYMALALLNRITGPGKGMTDLWMSAPPDIFRGTEQHPRLRERIRSVIGRHSWAELADGRFSKLTGHVQETEDLRRITADTLVVVGEEDMPAYHGHARTLGSAVPRCRLHEVPGAGHLCLLERAAEVAPVLAAQLAA